MVALTLLLYIESVQKYHYKNASKKFSKKISKKIKRPVDRKKGVLYNITCVADRMLTGSFFGVWLSLARAPGLGPGGRRFESCHPDANLFIFYAGVVQW